MRREAWPSPDATQLARSDALTRLIRADIDAAGPISFQHYMGRALYEPELGYYTNAAIGFGAAGDFVTAPTLTPLFARSLARCCAQVLRNFDGPVVLEVGAGNGQLAVDVWRALADLQCLPERYLILEPSAQLRAQQQRRLQQALPGDLARFEWIDDAPGDPINGVILANEVLDALPFRRFLKQEGMIAELGVDHRGDRFCFQQRGPLADIEPALRARLEQLPDDYCSELCTELPSWMRRIAGLLGGGVLLLLDYGYPRPEYYHPQRGRGSLLCHYAHRAHDDPFILVGLQDITASVDFTAVAEAGSAAGLALAGYTTQAQFLLDCGILELLEARGVDPADAGAVKQLLLPGAMGDRIQVMAFSRNLNLDLVGFRGGDLRWRLD